ncbi:MAG: 3-deoxy-D-manno-octulosonic acid transferase [Nitrospira sp.]|nr:3-deoxy-D-manno-octulosonic acid transferase [Nitrospira sp.]
MYFLYSLIYIIALLFVLPVEYFKRPGHIRKRWLKDKVGFFDSSLVTHHSSPIWVHAVSVGEVMAAIPLLKSLREKYPSKKIILSTITDTGQKVARERAPEGTGVVYLPFDIPPVITAVIKKVKPVILIIIETELWPNLIRSFRKNGIPVILLNGRISENSFRGYKRASFFMKVVLSHIDFFGMQGEEYAERIKSLGVNTEKVMNTGNFKFDASPPSQIPVWTEKIKGPVITAGSTHEGEEEFITSVYNELKKDFPILNLVIAPRHPERFKGVEDMLKSKGISFIKRSALNTPSLTLPPQGRGQEREVSPKSDLKGIVILLDTVGELSAIYGISDIAIIGKSFRGYGGQNPLEPACWGKPIVCGPHMENFPVIRDFYTEGAAIEVREDELYSTLKELLLSRVKAGETGSKAQELYRKNAGAVERSLKIVERYI